MLGSICGKGFCCLFLFTPCVLFNVVYCSGFFCVLSYVLFHLTEQDVSVKCMLSGKFRGVLGEFENHFLLIEEDEDEIACVGTRNCKVPL